MANFYTDNEDIKFHLGHPLMEKIVALKERNYTEAQQYDNAPRDFEDAFDNYDKVLEIVGEICGDVVAVNAESVDAEGPQVVDGHVKYAAGTQQNIDVINQAGLNGISLPRKYNGLNFPITPFIMAAEIVARPMPDCRTSGDYRIVPKRSTNLPVTNKKPNTCPAYVPARPVRWT